MKYKIIETFGQPLSGSDITKAHEDKINEWLALGWEPQGGISVHTFRFQENLSLYVVYSQALVLDE